MPDEKQQPAETPATDDLSAEEKEFFESGGEKELTPEQENEDGLQQEGQEAEAEAEQEVASDEEKQQDEKGRYVPHQALHAEREEHKKTRAELNDQREKWARLEERFNAFQQQQKPEDQPEDTPPDPNEDVFAALKWTQDKLLESQKEQQQARTEQEQVQQARQQDQAVWSHWENAAREYAQQNEDFPNAAKWLAEHRDKQLQALSFADPRYGDVRFRNQQIEAELKQIVVAAANKRMSPAEAVYEIAKGYGYTPEQAQAAADQAEQQQGDAAGKVEKLEKAQNASKTVGQASGRAGAEETTPQAVANMSESEFDAWISKPENQRKFEQIMGG